MVYAIVRKDLENVQDGFTEAFVYPTVTVDSADLTIPNSTYPIKVLHQTDEGLVYLLLNDEVVVGNSIDFDFIGGE